MAGDQFTIRIGGDASGPVVAGHGNRVETHEPQTEAAPADEPRRPDATQTNTAHEHGTVYTVMNGDMHVHHTDDPTAREQ